MQTLKIKTNDVNKAITDINKFRLKNKDNWHQIDLNFNGFSFKMKCFNTWIQLLYIYKTNKLLYNKPSPMDLKISDYKKHIKNTLENHI